VIDTSNRPAFCTVSLAHLVNRQRVMVFGPTITGKRCKPTMTRMPRRGATPHDIGGSVTGHTSIKEIERYTAMARRKPSRRRPSGS
jgi:hypothetical protein